LGSPLDVALKSLSSAVIRNLPFATQQVAEPIIEKPGFDFELVADNVTSFIETAVNQARERGESDAFLEDMLQQARDGVEQGFGEARDELEELGMMNEEIDQGIDKSFDLIQERLNNFEKQLFDPGEEYTSANQVEVSTYSSRSVSGVDPADLRGATLVGQSASFQVENSAALELVTRDGDKVSISFAALQAGGISQAYASSGEAEAFRADYSSEQGLNFSYSVEGDLSEDELNAIADFVNQVAGIADAFFGGNLDEAVNRANELGFDDSQIASFALDLQQTQTVSVTSVYQRVAGQPQQASPLAGLMEPLNAYIEQLRNTMEQAETLFDSIQPINDLVKQMIPLMEREEAETDPMQRFQDFNQRLLDALPPN
jgi:hypothetical protein